MVQQLINLDVPDSQLGTNLRAGGQFINDNFTELYATVAGTLNAATFAGASRTDKINNAITAAGVGGYTRVFIPTTMLPYDASLVTFNTAVQMVREGGSYDAYDLRAYGATGNGVVDDTIPMQACMAGAGAAGGGIVDARVPGVKLTAIITIPVRVVLRLGANTTVTSALPDLFRVNTNSAIIADAVGTALITTATAAGSIIATATPSAAVGSITLSNIGLFGQGSGNAGTIGLDMRGIASSAVSNVSADSFETTLVVGMSGAVTCYYNTFFGFAGNNSKYGVDLRDAGANEQVFVGGKIGTSQEPFIAANMSGLHVFGMGFEGYTVNGPEMTNVTGYSFVGCRFEQSGAPLTPFRHLGTSVGSLSGPEFAGNALGSAIETANESFSYQGAFLRIGGIGAPIAAQGIAGDAVIRRIRALGGSNAEHHFGDDTNTVANSDFLGNIYRSGASRTAVWYWYTANALKWQFGAGALSGTEDLVCVSAAAGGVATWTGRQSDGAFIVGKRLATPPITPSEAVLVSGVDGATGNNVSVTLTAARVVGAPLNPLVGQTILFTFIQNATGGFAVTFNAIFKGLTFSNTGNVANTRSSVAFINDGTNWNQVGAQSPWAA